MSEIEDRRQRAREAFYDGMGAGDVIESRAVEAAIEVATQVKITDEIRKAITEVEDAFGREQYRTAVARVFETAGFEVVEIE